MSPDLISTTINELVPIFTAISKKIGEGTNFIWPLFVKNAIINGVEELFAAVIFFGILLFGIRLLRYGIKYEGEGSYDTGGEYVLGGVLLIAFCLAMGCMFLCFGLSDVLNPQYSAFMDLIGRTRHGR